MKATEYHKLAFCKVSGREARQALELRGRGLGPSARFVSTVLDLGEIPVNTPHPFEVTRVAARGSHLNVDSNGKSGKHCVTV